MICHAVLKWTAYMCESMGFLPFQTTCMQLQHKPVKHVSSKYGHVLLVIGGYSEKWNILASREVHNFHPFFNVVICVLKTLAKSCCESELDIEAILVGEI